MKRCTSLIACRPGLALLAVMLLTGIAGCAARSQPVARPVARGNDLYVQGALAYQEGDRDRALAALQSALKENPDLIMARFLVGTIHKDRSEYTAAAKQFERVVELDPYSYINHYNLGLMYHLLDRLQEAATSYLQALKLNPEDVKSNMYLGMVYTALGRPEVGLPYVRKAADMAPQSAEAQANLAVVLEAMKDYTGAEVAYRRALELDSERPETAINLAGCLVSQKRYREAISVYEEVLKKQDSSLLRQRYGYALLQSNRHDEAIREFNLALKQNPRNFHALNGLGDALLGQYRQSAMLDEKKRIEAVELWNRSLQLNPEQPRVAALIKEYSGANLIP